MIQRTIYILTVFSSYRKYDEICGSGFINVNISSTLCIPSSSLTIGILKRVGHSKCQDIKKAIVYDIGLFYKEPLSTWLYDSPIRNSSNANMYTERQNTTHANSIMCSLRYPDICGGVFHCGIWSVSNWFSLFTQPYSTWMLQLHWCNPLRQPPPPPTPLHWLRP